jgi:intergrase/recombinase
MIHQKKRPSAIALEQVELTKMSDYFSKILLDIPEEKIKKAFTRKITSRSRQVKDELKKVQRIISGKESLSNRCFEMIAFINELTSETESEYTAIRFVAKVMFSKKKFLAAKSEEYIITLLGYQMNLPNRKPPREQLVYEQKRFLDWIEDKNN